MWLTVSLVYLQESKRNVLKDFVHIAGPLGVTQFLILTATENACYLRIAKAPRVGSHRLLPVRSAFWSLSDLPVIHECGLSILHHAVVPACVFHVSFTPSAYLTCVNPGHLLAKLMLLFVVVHACVLKQHMQAAVTAAGLAVCKRWLAKKTCRDVQ